MARPIKKGLSYFPFDVDIFEDDKLFDVQYEYGPAGEAVYLRLLCLVYRNGYYYRFDSIEKLAKLAIRSIGVRWIDRLGNAVEMIKLMVSAGLFDNELFEKNILTSKSIQRRYNEAAKKRKTGIEEYDLIGAKKQRREKTVKKETAESGSESASQSFFSGNSTKKSKVKKSKVKESKSNEIKEKQCVAAPDSFTETASEAAPGNVHSTEHTDSINKVQAEAAPEGADTFTEHTQNLYEKEIFSEKNYSILIPCRGGDLRLDENALTELEHKYTHIDIYNSFDRIIQYLSANPDKQRTKGASLAYIRMWLSSDNEKAAAAAARPKKTSPVCSAASYIDPVSWEKGLCEYESESVV